MMFRTTMTAMLALALCGCDRKDAPPEPAPSEAAPVPIATAEPLPPPVASPTASQAPPRLDTAALEDRKDPDRLLRYYAAALGARDWAAAARAWGKGSGVTAATLKAAYQRAEAPELIVGNGEGDAGSLFYEAPVTLRFGAATPERGSLILRRVNDVDGARADQLRWHIERSTIGQGQ